ncbi:MAG: elongation factor 4 [Spiroplasma sp.]|nr:elongation factor 4 [Mycoplasmatales bacterium]
MKTKNIRNFSIIAHIDHGKSTLADRILEITNTVSKREMQSQLLDSMELERERGITIKLNAVQLTFKSKDGEEYLFHLIDTPGHVDFNYEVSRALAACEGAILVVDAAQGVEAQTLANVYLAVENDLEILSVLNKIDLPAADPESVKKEIEEVIGIDTKNAVYVSAKSGLGITDLLEELIITIPPPQGKKTNLLKGLIFDSYYDTYRGVMISVRIFEGVVKVGDKITFMANDKQYEVLELGINNPKEVKKKELVAGEVGWINAGIKDISDTEVGDTITSTSNPTTVPLPGYKKLNPVVFSGIYPIDSSRYNDLRDALEKLKLSDSSLNFDPETSQALGFGFRCGFLGLLHLEIIQERLEREYNLELIATAPSVIYDVILTNGEKIIVENPSKLPDAQIISEISEPYIFASIMCPSDYVGAIMELCQRKRGIYQEMKYIDETRVSLSYELPLAEIVYDFFDRLKSISKGYASFDYEIIGKKTTKLVKVDILLNGEVVDALATIMHRDLAHARGKIITEKLKEIIPRQQFEVPIQAAIGNKVVARSTIKAMRKNVLAKCYGGDISRKKKLLEKQKKGKKRMKQVGSVEIPQEAFVSILKSDD